MTLTPGIISQTNSFQRTSLATLPADSCLPKSVDLFRALPNFQALQGNSWGLSRVAVEPLPLILKGQDPTPYSKGLGSQAILAHPQNGQEPSTSVFQPRKRMGKLQLEGGHFKDENGRTVFLRGLNFAADAKAPAPGSNRYLNVPCTLDEADEHFARIRDIGFNCLRFIYTWDALQPEHPDEYDDEYIDFTIRLVRKAIEGYDFYVFMDPHQDIWSRFSGGSGAPLWTLHAAGFDHNYFAETHSVAPWDPDEPHSINMQWASNYHRLVSQTMFTLFFAGPEFAPKAQINGTNVGSYLRTRYFAALGHFMRKMHKANLGPNLLGWESLNEPGHGLIGYEHLDKFPESRSHVKLGTAPNPFQGMLLGQGIPQSVETYKFTSLGTRKVKDAHVVRPKRGTWLIPEDLAKLDEKYGWFRNWPGGCLWELHGIYNAKTKTLLLPDYFTSPSDTSHYGSSKRSHREHGMSPRALSHALTGELTGKKHAKHNQEHHKYNKQLRKEQCRERNQEKRSEKSEHQLQKKQARHERHEKKKRERREANTPAEARSETPNNTASAVVPNSMLGPAISGFAASKKSTSMNATSAGSLKQYSSSIRTESETESHRKSPLGTRSASLPLEGTDSRNFCEGFVNSGTSDSDSCIASSVEIEAVNRGDVIKRSAYKEYNFESDTREMQLFIDKYFVRHWLEFSELISDINGEWFQFMQAPVNAPPPHMDKLYPELLDRSRVVYTPHFYDGMTLMLKRWRWLNVDAIGVMRDLHSTPLTALRFGDKRIRQCFAEQFVFLKAEGRERLGQDIAMLMSEIGIPYDMDNKNAYLSGYWDNQIRAMDANIGALEQAQLNYALWCYAVHNSHQTGDCFGGEDLSIYSQDDKKPMLEGLPENGVRAPQSVIRPTPIFLAGPVTDTSFNIRRAHYHLSLVPQAEVPTEVYIPKYHFPRVKARVTATVSDGDIEVKDQVLIWHHGQVGEEQTLTVHGDSVFRDSLYSYVEGVHKLARFVCRNLGFRRPQSHYPKGTIS